MLPTERSRIIVVIQSQNETIKRLAPKGGVQALSSGMLGDISSYSTSQLRGFMLRNAVNILNFLSKR